MLFAIVLTIFCVDIAKKFFCLPMELNMITDCSVFELEIELFNEFSNFELCNLDDIADFTCPPDFVC